MRIIFLILLCIISIFHLYDCYKDNIRRKKTKPFLLIFILLYYITSIGDFKNLSIYLIIALTTSWLGDLLLIPDGNIWFTLGGISFATSHISFIMVYLQRIHFNNINLFILIPSIIIYYGISGLVIYNLKSTTPKLMQLPMYIYLLCNSTMNIFALIQLMSVQNAGVLISYIGAVLFFISDCTLFLVRYYKNKNLIYKNHFTVMLTYILGELLITQGIIMLS